MSDKKIISLQKKLKRILEFKDDNEKFEFEVDVLNLKFVDRIILLMQRNDISKSELAAVLNTSKSYVTQLLSGEKLLNMKLLAKLQRIFNVQFELNFKSHPSKNLKK